MFIEKTLCVFLVIHLHAKSCRNEHNIILVLYASCVSCIKTSVAIHVVQLQSFLRSIFHSFLVLKIRWYGILQVSNPRLIGHELNGFFFFDIEHAKLLRIFHFFLGQIQVLTIVVVFFVFFLLLLILIEIFEFPLKNTLVVSAHWNQVILSTCESHIGHMWRMTSEFLVTASFEIRTLKQLDISKIVSSCDDFSSLISVYWIDISSVRTRRKNSLYWPPQNTSPTCPFFISVVRSSSSVLFSTFYIPIQQLVTRAIALQNLRVFWKIQVSYGWVMTFADGNSFEFVWSFENVNFWVSRTNCQKFSTRRKFYLSQFFLTHSFVLNNFEIRIVMHY